jgi:hypothetical protein
MGQLKENMHRVPRLFILGCSDCYIFHGKSTCSSAWTQQCESATIYEIKLCAQQCPMSKIVGMIVVKRGLYL